MTTTCIGCKATYTIDAGDDISFCPACGAVNYHDEPEEDPRIDLAEDAYDEGYYFSGTGEWSEDSSYEDYLNR
jgi:hypothetical protein